MNVLDLFAGPGGWDFAARQLGLDPLGIEWDDAACATRKAAGLRTLQADVSKLDPADLAPVDLLIGSPPCTDFSPAGKRAGLDGDSGQLVHEVVRWVGALRPMFVACEQVPPVLPIWQQFAHTFRTWGYRTWTGIVNAADYGVPQTRERAILLARKGNPVLPPEPTHCRGGSPDSMFGPGRLPWVSMAEALGWDEASALRHPRGSGMAERYGARSDKPAGKESMTVTSKARSWTLHRPSPTIVTTRRSNTGIVVGRQLPEGEGRAVGGHGWDGERTSSSDGDAVRVTEQEAALLQSFPPDYPWQGSRSKRFEQIGNAIPPRLALALLSAVTDTESEAAA